MGYIEAKYIQYKFNLQNERIESNTTHFEPIWLIFCTNLVNGESYIPKYVEGNPIEGRILTIDPPDLRKEDLYRIDHKVHNFLFFMQIKISRLIEDLKGNKHDNVSICIVGV